MASQRLKNTLQFTNLAPGASVVLPHGLRTSAFRPLAPDIIFIPSESLEVTASTTASVTLKNNGLAPLSGAALVEAWHTIERTFDGVQNVDLPVKPYIVVSDSAGDGDRNPMSPPEAWLIDNIGGEGAESGPMNPQVSTNFPGIMMIRAGSIVGARARLINTIISGSISATPTINGVPVVLAAAIGVGQSAAVATAAPGAIPYAAGAILGFQYAISDGFSPFAVMEAWLEVFEEV